MRGLTIPSALGPGGGGSSHHFAISGDVANEAPAQLYTWPLKGWDWQHGVVDPIEAVQKVSKPSKG